MNISVNFTGATAQDIITAMRGFVGLSTTESQPAIATPVVPKTKDEKEETATAAAISETAVIASNEVKTETAITIEQLRAIVKKKADAGKRDAVKALLQECGADKVPDLPVDKYQYFYDKVNKL